MKLHKLCPIAHQGLGRRWRADEAALGVIADGGDQEGNKSAGEATGERDGREPAVGGEADQLHGVREGFGEREPVEELGALSRSFQSG